MVTTGLTAAPLNSPRAQNILAPAHANVRHASFPVIAIHHRACVRPAPMWRVLPKPFVMMDRPGYRRGVDQRGTCAVEPKAYDWGSSKSSLAMGARSPFKGLGGGPERSRGLRRHRFYTEPRLGITVDKGGNSEASLDVCGLFLTRAALLRRSDGGKLERPKRGPGCRPPIRAAGAWRTKTGSERERAILSALITSRNVLSFCDGGPRTTFPPFAKRWV